MRLFVAIDLDDSIRQRVLRFMEGIDAFAPNVRWVSVTSLHITLKFIGESSQLDAIRHALNAAHGKPVEIKFHGTGFFPTARAPRVFWIGIEADEHLGSLAHAVDEALAPL